MKRLYFTLVSLFWITLYVNAQTVWHVNHAASGLSDGSNWEDAYTDLQEALIVASYGDQIWLAQGTYYPTSTEDRSIHFHLPKGVSLYGGFQGNETMLEERDWESNTTILSGNIGDPNTDEDNSYTVLYMDFADYNNAIDGLTIRDGNADAQGWYDHYGIAPFDSGNTGGGLYVFVEEGWWNEANFKVRNSIFENNKARNQGGSLIIHGALGSYSSPEFTNVVFRNNSTSWSTLYYETNTYQGQIHLQDCLFENNHSTYILSSTAGSYSSPAIFSFKYPNGGNSILVRSTTFKQNTSLNATSALSLHTGWAANAAQVIRIDSCQFIQNHSYSKRGALHIGHLSPGGGGYVPIEITNCLFLENTGENEPSALTVWKWTSTTDVDYSTVLVRKCDFVGNYTKGNQIIDIKTNPHKTYIKFDQCFFLENYSASFSSGTPTILHTQGDILLNNCVFQKNYGSLNTATAFAASTTLESDQVRINNCVFSKSSKYLPAVRFGHYNYDEVGEFYITNSIFYDQSYNPTKGLIERANSSNLGSAFIDNCLFDVPVYEHVANSDVFTMGPENWLGDNPMFMDWDADDLRLHPCSPWRNMGINEPWDDAPNALDLAGLPRLQEGQVDLGAYEIQPINLQVDSIIPACFGETNATLWLHPDYGCEQFEYYDDQGNLLTNPISGLAPGTFQVSVLDSLGRTDTLLVEVGESSPLEAFGQVGAASSASTNDGYFEILDIEGGTPPYSFNWQDNGSNSLWRYDLLPGTYTLEMIDVHGCSEEFSWDIDFLTGAASVPETITEFVLFPNPTFTGQVARLKSPELDDPAQLVLFDAQGKRLYEGTTNISAITAPQISGLYWLAVRVRSNEQVHWIKWVVLD